jgi:hypothetical protein
MSFASGANSFQFLTSQGTTSNPGFAVPPVSILAETIQKNSENPKNLLD